MLNRMVIAVLGLIGVLVSAYMAAYKFGFIGQVVCGTGSCETVQNSPWAVFLGIPVPVLGLAGYSALVALAVAGIQPRFEDDRRIALLLAIGAATGLAFSIYLSYLEAYVINAWCRWCIVSAILAGLIFIAALPELTRLRRGPAE